jgi:osmotically-inducible protein OsmY
MTALFGILLVGASAAMAVNLSSQATLDDSTMALHVKLALLEKLGNDSLHVEVGVTGAMVMLSGTVDKRETMELASTVAKTVPGVTDVDNKVRLESSVANSSRPGAAVGEADSEVKDALLETRLRLALIDSMGSDGFTIGTDAASGVVTLAFGHDLTDARRKQAMEVARHLSGVSKVISVDKAPAASTK